MTKKKAKEDILPSGRAPFYKSVKELESKIDSYFSDCPDKRMVKVRDPEGGEYMDYVSCPTITGLSLFLGFCSRQSMYDYEENPNYTYTIKKARTFIEREYESMLHNGQCTGAIFALKNMGWNDKTQTELTGKDGEAITVKKVYVTAEQQTAVEEHIKNVIE